MMNFDVKRKLEGEVVDIVDLTNVYSPGTKEFLKKLEEFEEQYEDNEQNFNAYFGPQNPLKSTDVAVSFPGELPEKISTNYSKYKVIRERDGKESYSLFALDTTTQSKIQFKFQVDVPEKKFTKPLKIASRSGGHVSYYKQENYTFYKTKFKAILNGSVVNYYTVIHVQETRQLIILLSLPTDHYLTTDDLICDRLFTNYFFEWYYGYDDKMNDKVFVGKEKPAKHPVTIFNQVVFLHVLNNNGWINDNVYAYVDARTIVVSKTFGSVYEGWGGISVDGFYYNDKTKKILNTCLVRYPNMSFIQPQLFVSTMISMIDFFECSYYVVEVKEALKTMIARFNPKRKGTQHWTQFLDETRIFSMSNDKDIETAQDLKFSLLLFGDVFMTDYNESVYELFDQKNILNINTLLPFENYQQLLQMNFPKIIYSKKSSFAFYYTIGTMVVGICEGYFENQKEKNTIYYDAKLSTSDCLVYFDNTVNPVAYNSRIINKHQYFKISDSFQGYSLIKIFTYGFLEQIINNIQPDIRHFEFENIGRVSGYIGYMFAFSRFSAASNNTWKAFVEIPTPFLKDKSAVLISYDLLKNTNLEKYIMNLDYAYYLHFLKTDSDQVFKVPSSTREFEKYIRPEYL